MELNVGDSNVVKGAGACWAGEMMMIFWACVHHNQLVEAPQRRLWTLGWKSLTQRLVSESLYDRGADVLLPCTTGRPCDVQYNAITFQCLCLCLCVCQCVRIYLCMSVCICLCGCWKLTFDQTHLVSFLPQTVRSSPILLQILDNRIQIWQQGMSDKTRSRSTQASIHKYAVNASWPNHNLLYLLKQLL